MKTKGKKTGHTAIRQANWRARASTYRVGDAERERMMKMVRREFPDADTRRTTPEELRHASLRSDGLRRVEGRRRR